jgi:acyl-homoserine-lactone acylase
MFHRVHAEDDFRNLEEVLAAVRGRAGAILGEDGAGIDFAGHAFDARGVADRGYMSLSPATRALVEAYAQGLNDYARSHAQEQRLQGLFPVTGRDIVAGFVLRSPFFFGMERVLEPLVKGELPPRDSGQQCFCGNGGAVRRRHHPPDHQQPPAVGRRRDLVGIGGAFG